MEQKKSVLIVGIDPVLIDFSSPDFAQQALPLTGYCRRCSLTLSDCAASATKWIRV